MAELLNGCLIINEYSGSLRKRSDDIQYISSSGEKYFYDIKDIKSIEINANIMVSVSVIEECMMHDINVIFTFSDKLYTICPK